MASLRAINHLIRKTPVLTAIPVLPSISCANIPLSLTRQYSNQKSVTKSERNETDGQVQTGFAEVVKENTKSAWYMSVIVAGAGVTILMFYAIFKELLSDKSPHGVYTNTAKRLMQDPKVRDALGEPIKAYCDESSRGRRGHVRHTVFEQNGVNHMRMKFFVHGLRKKGTVNLEVQENESGDYVYRYLFIVLEDFGRNVLVIEDNRLAFDAQAKDHNESVFSLS